MLEFTIPLMTAGHDLSNSLYRPQFERDNCGFGLIANIDGQASHWLVDTAIQALERMTHRGAIAADGKSGDGCGLLLKTPELFFRKAAQQLGISLGRRFATGMVFLNPQPLLADAARRTLNEYLAASGLRVAGWRPVPVDTDACGEESKRSCPLIEQVFVDIPAQHSEQVAERRLYVARRRAELRLEADPVFYVASLSSHVVLYKGLVMPANLRVFYSDLSDPALTSSLCVFHQRFSTNTLPQWRLAQPFRLLAHNGEINTIQGNRNWAQARGRKFKTDLIPELGELHPLVSLDGSDSASLDNMLEVLITGGMDLFRATKLLLPPAWQNAEHFDADLRAFYDYHAMHMESWDGPAGVVMTDGRHAACALDRNGLRPARYVITRDRHITLASEIGVYDYAPADIVCKGRLKPGEMLAADTETGDVLLPEDIDERLKNRQPYAKWLARNVQRVNSTLSNDPPPIDVIDTQHLSVYEKLFQVSFEERDEVIRALAEDAQEAVGSMGDDTPFPVMSSQCRSLYDYFRQQFAQVTNPPIDPLRESIVMSLETLLGRELNPFDETPAHAKRLQVKSPVLSERKFHLLMSVDDSDYAQTVISLNYDAEETLQRALQRVCDAATQSVRDGKVLLVLSDREIANDTLPIHAALATGAVHHRLIKEGLRCDANIVVETATARDPHHFAVLIGYGATVVYPYLAYAIIDNLLLHSSASDNDQAVLRRHYRRGINKGLFKIISKMGISTIASYRGAQLFEIVGLHEEVVERCFRGSISRVSGSRFEDLEKDTRVLAADAWNPRKTRTQGGLLKYVHGGEYHAFNPDVVQALQLAVESGDYADYRKFERLVNGREPMVLRDLLRLRSDTQAIALEKVEPLEAIVRRFDSAGMSLGALSPEAHETLAIAMNRLGGRSNSGEGGEDPARHNTERTSKIKQVASGRFGVTPHYLVNAEVLQIKIAQGAKPGEGGQLPGHKVNANIARLRHSRPGVALISPPPHHDIYSIEDLAQLIFDLKQVNPQALVSVKLVAEAGVGTIAAGVTKAYADLITISGYDGGTGASPLTSVKYAGSPWELGLVETSQTLRANGLRDKVRVQADGGLKTGLDVVKAAILGAESFGFGTAPMIAMGCKYLRICHLNNCATGVATQNQTLRMRHFSGDAQKVMNYFQFLAEDVREHLAALGVASLTDVIGRTDLLEAVPGNTTKQQNLDLSPILSDGEVAEDTPRYCMVERNDPFDSGELAERMVRACLSAVESLSGGEFSYDVNNTNRSIGARLSGEIARRHGDQGMAEHPITLHLTGTAGQSLGVWNAGGLHIYLRGDANDYVGKGMAGGKIVLRPPVGVTFASQETTIMGNTCLYGATGGQLFAAGLAGERFGVRNSGAYAVVEGTGDHACEYMTGGAVAILGETGVNFGAGMTGGLAFVLDLHNRFVDRYNHELIDIHRINPEHMEAYRSFLHSMLSEHAQETQSEWAAHVLTNFYRLANRFWLVKPKATELESLLSALKKAA